VARLPPIGFWSYVRRDDELFRGKVSELRELILGELEMQLGQKVPVFKDTASIAHGARWEEQTVRTLGDSAFFIPVLTPNFLQSEWCCREVRLFLDRERRLLDLHPGLPRTSRIFPIHFVDVTDADTRDEGIRDTLMQLQHLNFQGMRFQDYSTDPRVRAEVSRFVTSIRDLLRIQVDPPVAGPPREPRKPRKPRKPGRAPAGDGGEKEATAGAHDGPSVPTPAPVPPSPSDGDLDGEAPRAAPTIPKAILIIAGLILAVIALIVISNANAPSPYVSNDYFSNYADNGTDMTMDTNMTTNAALGSDYVNSVAEIGNAAAEDTNTLFAVDDVPTPVAGPSQLIYFANDCDKPVALYLRYYRDGAWDDARGGFWAFRGHTSATLDDMNVQLRATSNIFYFRARATDGSDLAWEGRYPHGFSGTVYNTLQYSAATNERGEYEIRIGCTDVPR
jgi:hypothetical protein